MDAASLMMLPAVVTYYRSQLRQAPRKSFSLFPLFPLSFVTVIQAQNWQDSIIKLRM